MNKTKWIDFAEKMYEGITPAVKEAAWGPGEWVDEPNFFEQEHLGFKICGMRTCGREGVNLEYIYGGSWCGYLLVPSSHPWHGLTFDQARERVECHWGPTFSNFASDPDLWAIGFDCAHMNDYVPSTEKFFKETQNKDQWWMKDREEIEEKLGVSGIFSRTYKNMNFVIEECKDMARQAYEAMNAKD